METKIEKKTQIILILNPSEASWFKSVVQNPFNPQGDLNLENKKDKEMRTKFWNVLDKYNFL